VAANPLQSALACADAHALLGAWVDGELSSPDAADEARAIEAHVSGCSGCSGEARALRQIKHLVRDATTRPAPHSLRLSVMRALDDAPEPEERGSFGRVLQRANPRTVAFGAAAAGVAVWFALGGLTHPILQQGFDHPFLDDGVALHARTFPLDYAATDAGMVQRWMETKLDFGFRLPHFGRPGPQPALQGVRLSTLHTLPAAMVSYTLPDSAGRRVSLLIVDAPAGEAGSALPGVARVVDGRDVFVSQARGYNVAAWRSGEIVYSLISDLDESDVLRLVADARQR
jgi:anti-sigma factor RsiW